MSEDQKRELIRVTQLPVIEEQLKALSAEIDTKVNEAMSMVCTEDTVKAVKKVRAELNSQFWELEGQRKAVKKAIMGPYERFEQIYSKYISQKFKAADDNLKRRRTIYGRRRSLSYRHGQQSTSPASMWTSCVRRTPASR